MLNNKSKKLEQELSNSSNTIGKGTVIEGDISTFGNFRIDGTIKGSVTSKSKIVLGPDAKIEGNLTALTAELSGTVYGKIEVSELLVLRPTSTAHGSINTGQLQIDSGAVLNGEVKMGAVIKEISIDSTTRRSQSGKEKTA